MYNSESLLNLLVRRCQDLLESARPTDCTLDVIVDAFYLDLIREAVAMADDRALAKV